MKKIILVLVLLVAGGFLLINHDWAPSDVEVATLSNIESSIIEETESVDSDFDSENYEYKLTSFDFQFTGYGPGKSHVGNIDSQITEDGRGVTFDMTTVKTDSAGLDEHLCQDDFFSCEEYPISSFALNSINPVSDTTARVTGVYEMKGIEKNISFVADVVEGSQNLSIDNLSASYNGQFLLDTAEFNFKVPIVEDNVLIEFDFAVSAEMVSTTTDQTI